MTVAIFAALNVKAEDLYAIRTSREKFRFKLLMLVIKMQCKTVNFDYEEILNILERL